MSNVDLSIFLDLIFGVDEDEVSTFGDLIHDHPNRVKLADSER
jgi:hypothetical protein